LDLETIMKSSKDIQFLIPSVSTKVSTDKTNYTSYKLRIKTAFECWDIEKRYSEFYSLHNQLKEKMNIKFLPKFPEKKFLKLSGSVVEERKVKLAHYMNELNKSLDIFKDDDLIAFINLNDKEMILSYMKNENPNYQQKHKHSDQTIGITYAWLRG